MKRVYNFLISIIAFTAIGLSIYSFGHHPKTAYVDLGKVYNEFELKKELGSKLTQVQQLRQNQIDSMKLDLNIRAKNLQTDESKNDKKIQNDFVVKRQQYQLRRDRKS